MHACSLYYTRKPSHFDWKQQQTIKLYTRQVYDNDDNNNNDDEEYSNKIIREEGREGQLQRAQTHATAAAAVLVAVSPI